MNGKVDDIRITFAENGFVISYTEKVKRVSNDRYSDSYDWNNKQCVADTIDSALEEIKELLKKYGTEKSEDKEETEEN